MGGDVGGLSEVADDIPCHILRAGVKTRLDHNGLDLRQTRHTTDWG